MNKLRTTQTASISDFKIDFLEVAKPTTQEARRIHKPLTKEKRTFPRYRTVAEQTIPSPYNTFYSERRVPSLHLAARWLETAGFKPGDKVSINCDQPGCLVIEVQKES